MIPIPQIYDTARRVTRTIIQTIPGVLALAGLYPLIVDALGIPKDSNIGVWLAASVVTVAAIAAAITRLMAIPAVNTALAKVRLDGHSGNVVPADTYTTLIPTQGAASDPNTSPGEFTGTGAY